MINYRGSCHCGAISFSFAAQEIKAALRCDCSICVRKGMVMGPVETLAREVVLVEEQPGIRSTYAFGTGAAQHHFCSRCGVHVFVEPRLAPGRYLINLGCIDGVDALRLPETIFDGKAL